MRIRFAAIVVLLLNVAAFGVMQTASYSAKLSVSALQPGQTAVVGVVVDIKKGLHAQSHTPLERTGVNYIKFEVVPDANPNVEFLDPIYPPAEMKTFAALGQQSVYTGQVVVYVPLRVKTDAKVGDVTLSGKLTWQACNDSTCFPPSRNKPFDVATKIVGAGEAVTPTDAALFSKFDTRIFGQNAPAVGNVDASPANGAPAAVTTVDFFGKTFTLGASDVWLAMLISLGVGILFNLMPCVLPVLPLKVIGFVEASQHSRARCFLLGCVFSAGVICFFGVLAQFVVVLRSLQWGQLFSYGWFIWSITIVLLIMVAGMLGLFEVVLPEKVYSVTPSHESIAGNFLFGFFTALLSSPCVAPMFPGILAWALSEPTKVGVSAFLMVGVGMALPYLVLSAFPSLMKWIPRTGPWSAVLKQTMAFLIVAVAVYFAGGRLGSRSQVFIAIFFVICAGMIFMVARIGQMTKRLKPTAISFVVGAVVVLISFAVMSRFIGGLEWEPYSDQAFAAARASGKPVLVEFTANWCPNCLSIEGTVYRDARTKAALNKYDVVLMRADLTDQDAPGWPKVNELNPGGGIPLTAIYAPRGGDEPADKLTSLYTVQNLLDALGRVAGGAKVD